MGLTLQLFGHGLGNGLLTTRDGVAQGLTRICVAIDH